MGSLGCGAESPALENPRKTAMKTIKAIQYLVIASALAIGGSAGFGFVF